MHANVLGSKHLYQQFFKNAFISKIDMCTEVLIR